MTAQAPAAGVIRLRPPVEDKPQTLTQMALKRFRRNRLAVGGIVVVIFFAVIALTADFISPFPVNYQYTEINQYPGTLNPDFNRAFVFGSDDVGRDIQTRMMYGARVSLAVGLISEFFVVLIGVPIGLAAGYFGGRVDNLLMRFTDVMYAFPDLLFLILIIATFGRSMWVIFIALGLIGWVTMARVVRGQVLQIKQMDYVLGARSIGVRPLGLMARHIIPNILGPIIVLVTLGIPGAIIGEATLTFLGVGIDPSTPTWGTMITRGKDTIFSFPYQIIFPALAIGMLTLAATFIGDGMRDAFDPKTKGANAK